MDSIYRTPQFSAKVKTDPIYNCLDICLYAPILGSFNDLKTVIFDHSSTSNYLFDEIYKLIPYGI